MAQKERVKFLNNGTSPSVSQVVYWMQASVRTDYNHALEYAIHVANNRGARLHVVFCLTPAYPGANLRHYWFLLEGLRDVQEKLHKRGVSFTVWKGDPANLADALAGQASTIIVDRGYLRHQRSWYQTLAKRADCDVVQVESNVVVPVELVSTKTEYSAATIRPKIHRHWDRFLTNLEGQTILNPSNPYGNGPRETLRPRPGTGCELLDLSRLSRPEDLADELSLDRRVDPSEVYHGGETEAHQRLQEFLDQRLSRYDEFRNVPDLNWLSHMSPYLHFGHISPVEIAIRAVEYAESALSSHEHGGVTTLLEELIVRRELAINFTEFNDQYDSFSVLPDWARQTLSDHAADPRPEEYSMDALESSSTADPYWNACQRELEVTGKMHGYMRMYWGKKILEWTADPEEAYNRVLQLNDTYALDGRDSNGYAGVAWVFGKHDRPWVERPIFGKIRYMNANGLKRKYKNIDRYVTRWAR